MSLPPRYLRGCSKQSRGVILCQARSDARGGAYYRKKMAEGKSRKEASRCLKRRISYAVFASFVADSQVLSRSTA
jgi:transposase